MFDRSLINPMMTGEELNNALEILPEYDDTIKTKDKSTRLVALSDLYNIYIFHLKCLKRFTPNSTLHCCGH